jgi:hypothetical protein
VITRIFSLSRCYASSDTGTRGCDPIGVWVLLLSAAVNVVVSYKIFYRQDPRTAAPRAIALGLGLPALFGLERGNIVVPCFTLFALGYGRLLRSARLRWLCVAAAINLKPYLILPLIGQFSKRKWRWMEGVVIAVVAIYAVTFVLVGDGYPTDLISNIVGFSQGPTQFSIHSIEYANSYSGILQLLNASPYPIMTMIGSQPVELLAGFIPPFRAGGILVVVACMGLAIVRPNVLTANRLGALSMALLLNLNSPGGYATVFLLFYVFQERWRSWSITIPIVVGYLLSIPWDYEIAGIVSSTANSYLTGRQVTQATSIDVGILLRPGLLILMEYGLAFASILEFAGFRRPVRVWEGPRELGPARSAAGTT